jgi:hypothetical protein
MGRVDVIVFRGVGVKIEKARGLHAEIAIAYDADGGRCATRQSGGATVGPPIFRASPRLTTSKRLGRGQACTAAGSVAAHQEGQAEGQARSQSQEG